MAGYTQDDMASLLGIDRTTYNKKETQERKFADYEKDLVFLKLKEKIPNLTKEELFPIN